MRTDKRLFAPFPIEMDEHPKILPLSDAAFRALFEATFYSRRMLSDGFLDERVVLRKWGAAVAEELSTNDPERPTWVRVEGGWQIHDFEKHHPLRADVEGLSASRAAAGSAGGKASVKARESKPQAKVKQTGSQFNPETETETETTTSNEVVKTRKRATRIPAGWKPSVELIDWAALELPHLDVLAETPNFIDYWTAAPGARGLKENWDATWRTWMRRQTPRPGAPARRPTRTEENMSVVQRYAAQESQQQEIRS